VLACKPEILYYLFLKVLPMDKKVIITSSVAALLAVAIVMFFISSSTEREASAVPANGGQGSLTPPQGCDELECFVQAAAECKKASYIGEEYTDMIGLVMRTRYKLTLTGPVADGCRVDIDTLEQSLSIGEEFKTFARAHGSTDEQIADMVAQAEAESRAALDRVGTCVMSPENIVAMVERFELEGYFPADQLEGENCTGTLFSG
jgi:hypothetical protein